MYLIYIDESGKPALKDQTPLFVQAAFAIIDDDWQSVDNAVNGLKMKWFPDLPPSEVEFHAYEIVNQKRMYKSLGKDVSLLILEEIYELIANIDCTLLASVIHKRKLYKLKDQDVIELWSHRFLFERVCKFLDKENARRISSNESPQYGILLIDSINTRYNATIKRKYQNFFNKGTHFQQNEYLIEDPMFVDSQYRNMAQLVDVVAYTVNRRTNVISKTSNRNQVDEVIKTGYQTILPKFDTGSSGTVDGCGIKHFPK